MYILAIYSFKKWIIDFGISPVRTNISQQNWTQDTRICEEYYNTELEYSSKLNWLQQQFQPIFGSNNFPEVTVMSADWQEQYVRHRTSATHTKKQWRPKMGRIKRMSCKLAKITHKICRTHPIGCLQLFVAFPLWIPSIRIGMTDRAAFAALLVPANVPKRTTTLNCVPSHIPASPLLIDLFTMILPPRTNKLLLIDFRLANKKPFVYFLFIIMHSWTHLSDVSQRALATDRAANWRVLKQMR